MRIIINIIDDVGLYHPARAAYKQELYGQRIINALWDPELAERWIFILSRTSPHLRIEESQKPN